MWGEMLSRHCSSAQLSFPGRISAPLCNYPVLGRQQGCVTPHPHPCLLSPVSCPLPPARWSVTINPHSFIVGTDLTSHMTALLPPSLLTKTSVFLSPDTNGIISITVQPADTRTAGTVTRLMLKISSCSYLTFW